MATEDGDNNNNNDVSPVIVNGDANDTNGISNPTTSIIKDENVTTDDNDNDRVIALTNSSKKDTDKDKETDGNNDGGGQSSPDNGSIISSVLSQKLSDGFKTLRQQHNSNNSNNNNKGKQQQRNNNISFNKIKTQSLKSSDRPVFSCATVNFIDPTSSITSSIIKEAITAAETNNVPPAPNTPPVTSPSTKAKSFKIFGSAEKSSDSSANAAVSSATGAATSSTGVPAPILSPWVQKQLQTIDLYGRFMTIFDRDYKSTLNSVPYQNIRTGNSETINQLFIRSTVGDQASSAGGVGAEEWHNTPHCHVCIAAVENMHHYKSKVRPALQAYVRQIEGIPSPPLPKPPTPRSSSSPTPPDDTNESTTPPTISRRHSDTSVSPTAANSSSKHGGSTGSAHYVIIYVPVGNRNDNTDGNAGAATTPTGSTTNSRNLGFGSRKKKSGKKEKHKHVADEESRGDYVSMGDGDDDDETASTAKSENSSSATTSSTTSTAPGSTGVSSKVEKEIYAKFTKDFPNGKVCIMSTLLLDDTSTVTKASSKKADAIARSKNTVKNKEWDTFLRMLGNAVVSGFKDRCQQYDDEIRTLDSKRAGIVGGTGAGKSLNTSSSRRGSSKKNKKGENNQAGTSLSQGGGTADDNKPFDLSRFFLVKESLAFTYEQMQLPGEALLQYDELGAFVLDTVSTSTTTTTASATSPKGGSGGDGDSNNNKPSRRGGTFDGFLDGDAYEIYLPAHKNGSTTDDDIINTEEGNDGGGDDDSGGNTDHRSAMLMAVGGDTVGFRNCIRGSTDLVPILPLVLQYLFARETSLLFQLSAPVEIIRRTHLFITTIYNMRIKAISTASKSHRYKNYATNEQYKQRKLNDVEAWALGTCWDVKCASNYYFAWFTSEEASSLHDNTNENSGADSRDSKKNGAQNGNAQQPQPQQQQNIPVAAPTEREAACKMSELLEFACLRFLRLGDAELDGENPIRRLSSDQPDDMKKPWSPWDGSIVFQGKKNEDDVDDNSLAGPTGNNESNSSFVGKWLDGMCSSRVSYESKYLELTSAIVTLCQLAGRTRSAARLEAERAEIFIGRKEYELAESILVPIVDICAEDQWDRGHVWRLFRLVCCQRMLGDAPAYLNTLTRCFGSRLSSAVPPKTAELLQRDLEAVVGDEELAKYHLGVSPFLDTELSVEATSAGKIVAPLVSIRRKVVKNFCTVGESALITLYLTSHLPKSIEVDSIKLYLVTFDKYESIYMDTPTEEDSFRVLSFEPPIIINPGKNECKFNWIPMNTGQYILSAIQIRWKASCFIYRTCALRKPLMGIDVLPSDPTQTIELNPLFLIPGHVQPVRIVFHSGSDVITEGSVELICSEGLQVIPPGADPNDGDWSQSCRMLLPSCGAGEKIVLTTSVKSKLLGNRNDDSSDNHDPDLVSGVTNIQTMHAKVATFYHHGLYNEAEMKFDTPAMKTVLEAMVTTLDRAALTVDNAEAFSYMDDMVFVKVLLHCNTPVPFFIKEWEICLPPPLRVEDNGDLNKDLFGHAIAEGEQLKFGFKCVHYDYDPDNDDEQSAATSPILHVVLQDEFGKTFNQVLALDSLKSFYDQILKEDEFATAYNSVSVVLESSFNEGLVGAPVTFTYRVDTSTLSKPTRRRSSIQSNSSLDGDVSLFYSLSCNEMDWILGGKVQGILETNSSEGKTEFSLQFVGIPTRPGIIDRFPTISFKQIASNERDEMPHITVQSQHPDLFKSLSFVNHMALACPAGIS